MGERQRDQGEGRPKRRRALLIWVLFVFVGLGALLMVPLYLTAKKEANRTLCNGELRRLGLAAQRYAEAKGRFPYANGDFSKTIALLREGGYLDRDIACPEAPNGGGFDGFKAPWSKLRPAGLLVWHTKPHYPEGIGRNVLVLSATYGPHSVGLLSEEFLAKLAEHEIEAEKVLNEKALKKRPR